MKGVTEQNNFIYFTLALIVLLIASAGLRSMPEGDSHRLLQGIMLLTELVAYFSLNLRKEWRRFILVMIVLMLVVNVLREFTSWHMTPLVSLTAVLIFYCGMAYAAARQVLFSGRVDANTIIGAVAIYLLLGLIWSVLYMITLEFWHGAFNGIEYRDWSENFNTATYFSYVTMTSLGYGDISPAVPVSRVLAYLQAICGTFYMAVVVASMIGARTSKNPK
ncbi:MAG: two pore domain potassium channel family protein [Gammaproteobacteria bacterium]|nr:MAG: two pore domain potassium channel family protein [Gammaproteobacteria bacterium]RLA53222.1 MAG: two pore domain potassium channel family protein [Gammaproteobacteria bacterium]